MAVLVRRFSCANAPPGRRRADPHHARSRAGANPASPLASEHRDGSNHVSLDSVPRRWWGETGGWARCWLPWRTPGRAPSRRRARRTRRACHRLILVDQLDRQIARELKRLGAHHPYVPLLMTAPGVGWLVGFSIATVIGDIERFSSPSKLRSYTRKAARSLARLAIPEFVQP